MTKGCAHAVNATAAAGEPRRLPTVEQMARRLGDFTRDQPSVMERMILLNFNDSSVRLWPPVQRLDPTLFQPAPASKATTPRWHEAAAERDRLTRERIVAEQEIAAQEKRDFYGQH